MVDRERMKNIYVKFVLTSILIGVTILAPVHAQETETVDSTGTLVGEKAGFHSYFDIRIRKLQEYLMARGSPLASAAKHFVMEADRLGLDWRLVAAIAGTESYFGQHTPYNSFNAWGWAVYTGYSSGRNFIDWKDGITVVSEGLRYTYVDRGAVTVEQMGKWYAADPNWDGKVHFFLAEIENFTPSEPQLMQITL